MHDMLGEFPWILNPEWQVLAEEKALSTILRDWASAEPLEEDQHLRVDFLALNSDRHLVIIEIKRSGYPVTLAELQRLEAYGDRLLSAWDTVHMVLISGGTFNIRAQTLQGWQERENFELFEWRQIYQKARQFYEHYRAVLEGDLTNPDFAKKSHEHARTRLVLDRGSVFRDRTARKAGLGEQDFDYGDDEDFEG